MTEEKVKATLPVELDSIGPEEGLTLTLKKPFGFFFAEEGEVIPVTEVDITVSLTKSGDEVFAAGVASGTVRLQCARCLAEFDSELNAVIEAPFFPKGSAEEMAGEEAEEEEMDEGDVNIYEGKHLDLYPVIRDQLYLALPIKPLCREDCKGLCPKCGADRNVTTCGCTVESHDSRLAVLQKLKGKL
ncbi:MAG: DUF177 domain-containing protein [Nitrospinae bacterium]|nr:DUF177 domain-containing protein [Nitrospinota bacterium]